MCVNMELIGDILGEHLKFVDCQIFINQICVMFTLCLKFGIAPDYITYGIPVPLFKKVDM